MSQFVETRVGDFLGRPEPTMRPMMSMPRPVIRKDEPEEGEQDDPSADQIFTF